MIGIHSQFRQEVYDDVDHKSKVAVSRYLSLRKFSTNITEDYGPDVKAWNPDPTWHECEKRMIFKDVFPYNTVHVPERKSRLKKKEFWELGLGYFWVISDDYSRAIVFTAHRVFKSPLVEVFNTREPEGEYFFDVPIEYGHYRDLI